MTIYQYIADQMLKMKNSLTTFINANTDAINTNVIATTNNTDAINANATAIASKIGHADYATSTVGGTVKVRYDGLGNLYITTDGTNP